MTIRKSILALAFAASCALAALPSTMLFQGHVTLPAADANGAKELTVSLYDAETAGSLVWSDNFQNVVFTEGRFVVQLGAGAALPAFDKPLFIQLTVGTLVAEKRTPLTLAPYAKRAAVAETAILADRATVATKAETADALVSAADKSVALKDGNGKTQVTVSPNGGIQLPVAGTVAASMTTDPRGVCDVNSQGRIVYTKVAGLTTDRLYVCLNSYLGSGSMGYEWKQITTN